MQTSSPERQACAAALVLVIASLAAASFPAEGSTFLTPGSETKAAAGAGVTQSKSAPALHFNPANLERTQRVEPYVELSWLSLRYRYAQPGQEPVDVAVDTPIPFLGVALPVGRSLAIGATLQAVPESAGAIEVDRLPTREMSEEALLVDIRQQGLGTSYTLGLGASLALSPSLTLGASLIQERTGVSLDVKDDETGALLQQQRYAVTTRRFLLGLSWAPIQSLRVYAATKPYAPLRTEGEGRTAGTLDDGFSPIEHVGREAPTLAAGVAARRGRWTAFVELTHEAHGHVRTNAIGTPKEYHASISGAGGLGLRAAKVDWGVSASLSPTHVGSGIMPSRAEEGGAIDGAAFGDLDAITRTALAASARIKTRLGSFAGGPAYHFGSRRVPEEAKGYGTYELQVFYLAAAWRCAI